MRLHFSSEKLKAEALRLGFSACGLAPAEPVDESTASAFQQWLADDCEAEMTYMQNYEDKRLNPCLLVEGARTVISVALNYYPSTLLPKDEYQIAWYAYGKDYHDVMKAKLRELLEYIQKEMPLSYHKEVTLSGVKGTIPSTDHVDAEQKSSFQLQARLFCDTAPILERYWAWRSGLGWIGRNTQLIIPKAGSCFFLGEIIINVDADQYDTPQGNHCGTCTRCIEACPTQALEAPFRLNAKKCLSYLTIEHRSDLPPKLGLKMGKKIYGCDECQSACPWNRFATPCLTPEFSPSTSLLNMRKEDWHRLTEEQYRTLFKGSAVKRAKYEGLMRNIATVRDTQ